MRLTIGILFVCAGCLGSGFPSVAMAATGASSNAIKAASGHPSSTVFRIGAFDRSSFGFAEGAPTKPVQYIVGKSQPAKDWYATQPVDIEAETKAVVHSEKTAPCAISFLLTGSPARAYRLHIALLIESASVPALRIGINQKHGTFYLHPKLDYSNGDQGDSFNPAYSHADVSFSFPGDYLHAGKNQITLQAIEKSAKAVPDANLAYDAIELDQSAASRGREASSAQIDPTVFYPLGSGPQREMVDVFIRYRRPVESGSTVELNLAGQHYRRTLQGNQDFGEEKLEFPVAEFPAGTRAQVTWKINGHRERKEESIDPAKKWTLLLVPHIHLDVGYSDYQAKIAAIQSHALDEALDMTAKHPDFRFSTDGEWNLEQFLKTRALAQQQRAIAALQKRQLFVPANYANLLTGFPTAETLIRSLYASANFSRLYGTPFNYATITDVPSYSWSYPSILASAGIHYLLSGSNNYRAPVLLQGHLNENSPMWWQGPDGQKVLFWYSRHYMAMQMLFGLPPLLSAGHDTLPLFLQQFEHPGYRANAVILYGTQVENTDLDSQQAELAQQWNSVYAYPHMQYSGFHDALKNIAQQFGNDNIPIIRGGGGPYWEDGIASDAYYAAMERQNESRGPSAEKLATLTALINPLLAANKTDLDRMWTNMVLMDEHTWDSYNSVSQPTSMEAVKQLAVKDQYAVNAHALADFVARNSMASLANSISASPGSLIVFNTLNWKRSGLVSVDLDDAQQIVDLSTGLVVPVEILRKGKGFDHVRFLAENVPAVGYKVFRLHSISDSKSVEYTTVTKIESTTTLESPFYRVTLDPSTGSVRSIYDKQLHRELVNQQSPYRFGQYLYVSGGDHAPNTILQYSHVYPKPHLQIHVARNGKLLSVQRTPYGQVARMESTDMNTPAITTEIRLFNLKKKIEIVVNIDKKEVGTKEAVYFAFPFFMKQPQFQYEIQTGVVDPSKDMYAGAGHEWFSVQHWIAVQQNGISAAVLPLDASLVTLGDINRGDWPAQFGQRPGNIFSYIMNNY